MARKKPLHELIRYQTVNYPSRSMSIQRQADDAPGNQMVFKVYKKYPDYTLMDPIHVPAELSEDSYDTELFLNMAEEGLDKRHRVLVFQDRMRLVKRGIRGNVRKHLRRKYGTLPAVV